MYRKLFYAFNLLLLAAFVLAAAVDYKKDWRRYQKEYFRRTAQSLEAKAAQAGDPDRALALRAQAAQARREPIMIRQIIAKDLGRVDRCITCHVGMDEFANPTMTTESQDHPFTGHPDVPGLVKSHPFQKFACTTCHAGQGIATDLPDAHGETHNWEKPLLKGPLLQSSCAKCHGNFETLPGAATVAKGKQLFETHGCYGCHSIRGWGGVISVDLGDIADKPLERIALYNFSLVKDGDGKPLDRHHWKLPAWIMAHLTNDPMDFVPNDPKALFNKEPIAPSGMPDFSQELPPGGAEAIAAYLLSMTMEEQIPYRYYVPASQKQERKPASPVERGRLAYRRYGCAGCHGIDAQGGRRNYNAMGPGQQDPESHEDMAKGREPTLPDTVGTFSRDELRTKIQEGVSSLHVNRFNPSGPVPPLYMPAWKDRIKGAELEDLMDFLFSIAKKEKPGEEW